MYIKRYLVFAVVLFATASSLSTDSIAQVNPNYHRSRTRPVIPFRHLTLAAPPGMVYIPGGAVSIKYSQSSTDTNSKKRVSLSSFYIDKTEVTNQQYRMFTEWVIDSIAIVNYLKDDWYFLDPPPAQSVPKEQPVVAAEPVIDSVSTSDTVLGSLSGDIAPPPAPTPVATDTIKVAMADTSSAPKFTTSEAITDSNGNIIRRRINWARVNHKDIFENDDDEIKAKIAPMYDPVTGKIKQELYVYSFTYLMATGTNKNVKVGEYNTIPINVYPDEKIWFKDLNNSQVEILVENYFTQPPFDDYPVVGVTWQQARAFAAWRSHTNNEYADIAEYLKYYHLQYSLPSEAQWVYAAGKDIKDAKEKVDEREPEPEETPADTAVAEGEMPALDSTGAPMMDSTAVAIDTTEVDNGEAIAMNEAPDAEPQDESKKERKRRLKKEKREAEEQAAEELLNASENNNGPALVDKDRDGNLLVNFKQEEGDYSEDGANFTLPVMSYAPNEFGVYNMVGNVAEWVLDAYSPSAFAFVSDVNPVLLYDADTTDADAMKRKVVRGGSFISNAKSLSPFTRDFELQDNLHCYIGFRCVMSAPEILTKKVATRRKLTGSTKPGYYRATGKQPANSSKSTSKKK